MMQGMDCFDVQISKRLQNYYQCKCCKRERLCILQSISKYNLTTDGDELVDSGIDATQEKPSDFAWYSYNGSEN